VQAQCNVPLDQIERAAQLLAQSENALIIYGPMAARGKAGQDVLNALTNLALLTGHAERLAYVGLNANSQGCRDMGVLPNQLPGHASLDDEATRARLGRAWGADNLPSQPGKTYTDMLNGAGESIRALYIMGANPATERPEWAQKLENLDLLVVQDLFLTETAQRADVVLPAVSWAESNGTFTSCERRVQRAPKALTDPHSKAAPDWMILDHLANRLGVNWPYADAKGVLAEISEVVPIYQGLTWDALGDHGLQWDAEAVRPQAAYRQAEQPELESTPEYPLALVTGTVSYDGGTLFWLTQQMRNMAFGPVVSLHPSDAEQLGLDHGAPVTVQSAHGELALQVKVNSGVKPGTAWIPESLPGAPVGALLNGRDVERVQVQARG
jgi:predicted molibdopterin-dependent oxidoreductase YjgC